MDFDWNCLLGKFQPSQLVCTPRSTRYKIRYSRKTVCANESGQNIRKQYQGLPQENLSLHVSYSDNMKFQVL